MLIANRDQVIAFRLEGQHLNRRLPAGSLLAAAGACGMQNTPPGSAELGLHARVGGLAPGDVDRALVDDRSLLQLWSLRASPYIFPTGDAAAFTRGLAPVDEDEIRRFIFGVEPALDRIGISARRVVELAAEGLNEILAGRALTKDELGIQIARWMSPRLEPGQALGWQSASWYAPGQSLGESVVRFALPILALQGRCCHAERQGSQAFFRLTREWLGSPLPDAAAGQAQAGLVRRYLGCYGPSTAAQFGEWAGISPAQAARAWQLVEPELVETQYGARKAYLLRDDLPRFESPAAASGVRFLPPHDPYLALRDRATLVPDKALQRSMWLYSGNPGALLVNGRLAAMWRPQKQGKRLKLTITWLAPGAGELSPARSEIEAEALALAPFKGCAGVEIAYLTSDGEP